MNNLYTLEQDILTWANNKGILNADNKFTQACVMMEEATETLNAVNHGTIEEVKDGIGDVFVTIAILAKMYDLSMIECVTYAYEEISVRTGELNEQGRFIKDA